MDRRKEEIIEIALRRFSHYGFGKTTMNEIADDLKITKANLYYYYSDKTALIKDVMCYISSYLIAAEEQLINDYKGDILGTLFALLKFRSEHMRKYYMLYINENLDWIKGLQFSEFMVEIERKDVGLLKILLQKAVDSGELILDNIEDSTLVLRNIFKGLALNHTVEDIICGIPNVDNVDKILDSQMKAVKLIFEQRIVTHI